MSEDPVLNSALAAPLVTGIQSNNVSACVKHFIFNSQEYDRQGGEGGLTSYSASVGERAAFELYVPPYAAAVAAGVGSVMCSFNREGGQSSSGAHSLTPTSPRPRRHQRDVRVREPDVPRLVAQARHGL